MKSYRPFGFPSHLGLASVAGTLIATLATAVAAELPTLVVPAGETIVHLSVELPSDVQPSSDARWELVEMPARHAPLPAQLMPSLSDDGTVKRPQGRLLAIVPPLAGAEGPRRFRLRSVAAVDAPPGIPFEFKQTSPKTLQLDEDGRPVFAYNHGIITDESVPEADHRRSCGSYLHPVWGISGEVLTDAFPSDHYHHQGLFWRWKDIAIDGRHFKHWEYTNIRTRFVRWLHRGAGPVAAVLGLENGWFADEPGGGERRVMIERVWITAFRSNEESRSLDITLTIIPVDKPVTLTGADGKSYGGLTMRFDAWPRTDVVVRAPGHTVVDEGRTGLVANGDLANTPLPWADLVTPVPGCDRRSGAAVFIDPRHPDYPPSWLTRCYGPLCVGWPGVEPKTLQPAVAVRLPYRVWIHRDEVDHDRLEHEYASFTAGGRQVKWE